METPILEFDNATIQYTTESGPVTAVSNASFSVGRGSFFGLVGESGCGKSTLAKSIIGGLDENGKVTSGKILYNGTEIQEYTQSELNKKIRWNKISYIPQASMNSLDPLSKVSDQAWEIASVHTELEYEEAMDKFRSMFNVVGLQESRIDDYPHQFSGGMQQRAIIALSLFLDPKLIIADEPTTALDVIMQDQVLKYLDKIQENTQISMLLITHDISVVLESCNKMAIMHSGQVAETGSTTEIFDNPKHPYSILLQEAFPDHREPNRDLTVIDGYPPETIGDIDYCTFASRCPWETEECHKFGPPLENISDNSIDHKAACVRKNEMDKLRNERRQSSMAGRSKNND